MFIRGLTCEINNAISISNRVLFLVCVLVFGQNVRSSKQRSVKTNKNKNKKQLVLNYINDPGKILFSFG